MSQGEAQPRRAGAPEPVTIERDGLRVGALDWGGDGRPLVLLPATGMCAGIFEPLAKQLVGDFRPISIDLRGHGISEAPRRPDDLGHLHLARDVLALLDELGIEQAIALGHSLGGIIATLTLILRPDVWSALGLCGGGAVRGTPERLDQRTAAAMRRAHVARKRREVWESREQFKQVLGGKPPLDELSAAALDAYARWGTVERDDGQFELACSREVEAWYYEISMSEIGLQTLWDRHDELAESTTRFVGIEGGQSETFEEKRARLEGIDYREVVVPGRHFFAYADEVQMAQLVGEQLIR